MSEMLSSVEIDPPAPATASIIWLHGLGADGRDFVPIIPELKLPENLHIRFIFPNAPSTPVTISGGEKMPAWYDIMGIGVNLKEDEAGIQSSAEQVVAFIKRENERGIPNHKIVLAGFSQGGSMALYVGLRYPEKLAGLVVLSAYLPVVNKLEHEMHANNKSTPIFMGHGLQDEVIPIMWGKGSHDHIKKLGGNSEFHEYPMHHGVCLEETLDLGRWLTNILSQIV